MSGVVMEVLAVFSRIVLWVEAMVWRKMCNTLWGVGL
jgi:hypothetical protein